VQRTAPEDAIARGPHAGQAKAKMYRGTNASMLLAERTAAASLAPIDGCTALYTCQGHVGFAPAITFSKPDQLANKHTLLPGLSRCDADSQRTLATSGLQSNHLDAPCAVACQSVQLTRLEFKLDEAVAKCAPLLLESRLSCTDQALRCSAPQVTKLQTSAAQPHNRCQRSCALQTGRIVAEYWLASRRPRTWWAYCDEPEPHQELPLV
jgi:hypothetical protein